ncbi:MAG: ankyrin repeat domain-containing protein [Pseudomonadota bacterium]
MNSRHQEFCVACLSGNLADIQDFIDDTDFDISASVDNTDSTGLILATKNGQYEAVKLLIKAGADVNRTDNKWCSALHYAALRGNERIATALLAGNANPDLADDEGCTPLMRAASAGHLHVLLPLLDAGSFPDHIDHKGNTALLHGAYNFWNHVVETLLDYGAEVNHRNHQNEGVLDGMDRKRRKSLAVRANKTRKVIGYAQGRKAYIDRISNEVKNENILSPCFNDNAGSAQEALIRAAASDQFGAYLDKMIQENQRPDVAMLTRRNHMDVSAMDVLLAKRKFNELCRADLWTGQEDQLCTLQKEVLKGWQQHVYNDELVSLKAQMQVEQWTKKSTRPKLKTRRQG